MSSCCGGGDQTSTTTTKLPSWLEDRYKGLLQRGEDVSNLPYTPYGGQRVAEFTPDQIASFQGIRDASGAFQSDLDKAREQAGISAMPLEGTIGSYDPNSYKAYDDPYQQQVVDATLADINRQGEIARRDLDARAGVGGGIGSYGPSDRATLERSEQWRDQSDATARTIGQLRSQGYSQAQNLAQGQFNTEQNRALAARQNDAGRAAAAAGQYVGIGGAEQQYGLTGAQAQYGAGAAQQGQEQRGLDTAYSDFLAQRGYPAEQAQYLSSIYRGTPYDTTQTQTASGANPWTQAAGLGIAGIAGLGQSGAFGSNGWLFRRGGIVSYNRRSSKRMARGGRVRGYASGGIASYAPGGTVDVYAGLSNEDLGRMVDAGNADAYDEYVRRLTTGRRGIAPTISNGSRPLGLPDLGIAGVPPLKRFSEPGQSGAEFYNGRLSDSSSGEPHYSGAGDFPSRPSRAADLSDLGIAGLPGVKIPDWVPDWRGGRDTMAADAGGGHDDSLPDYTASTRMRGQPGQRFRGEPPLDGGIASASMPGPSATDTGPRFPLPARKPTIGHNGGPPMEDQGISSYDYGDAGAGRRGIMTGGGRGIADADAQSIVKQAGGASADAKDAPSWAMPLMVMGLSMAASRNPSMLGAIGEAGIAGLSSYIDQKRQDSANATEAEKIQREIDRDTEASRHNQATEANQATSAEGLAAYRASQAEDSKARTTAYVDRTKSLNARAGAGGAGNATALIISNILADAKASGKKIAYSDAVRMAHGASTDNKAAIERLAQGYARGKVGQFGTGDDYTKALDEGRKLYGALGGEAGSETDNADGTDNQDTIYNYDDNGELIQ
jgi:hypothetical protein